MDTAGTQTYNDAVGGATPLTELIADSASTGGSIQFNMAVSGSGAAGVAADSLTLDAAAYFNVGDSTANSPSVRTSDVQTYNGPVQLQSDTVLVATARGGRPSRSMQRWTGRISWTSETAGTQAFNGVVGSQTPLADLIADSAKPGARSNSIWRHPAHGRHRGEFVDAGRRGPLQYWKQHHGRSRACGPQFADLQRPRCGCRRIRCSSQRSAATSSSTARSTPRPVPPLSRQRRGHDLL